VISCLVICVMDPAALSDQCAPQSGIGAVGLRRGQARSLWQQGQHPRPLTVASLPTCQCCAPLRTPNAPRATARGYHRQQYKAGSRPGCVFYDTRECVAAAHRARRPRRCAARRKERARAPRCKCKPSEGSSWPDTVLVPCRQPMEGAVSPSQDVSTPLPACCRSPHTAKRCSAKRATRHVHQTCASPAGMRAERRASLLLRCTSRTRRRLAGTRSGTEVKCKDPSDSFYQAAADPLVAVPSLQPRPGNSAQPHLGRPAARSTERNGAEGGGDGIASSGPAAGARAGSTGASTATSMASCTS